MKFRLALFITIAVGVGSPWAARAHEGPIDGMTYQLGGKVYGIESKTEEGFNAFNPDNRTAELAAARGVLLAQADLTFEWSVFKAVFKPRAQLDSAWSEVETDGYFTLVSELYIQDALLTIEHDSGFRLTGGRYYYDHGPSVFLSPSNPFVFGSARLNPKIDPPSREFAAASYVSESGWSAGVIANLGPGRDTSFDEPFHEFVRSYAARFELAGESSTTIIMASVAEDLQGQAGANFQLTLSESILAWTDFAVSRGHRSFAPIEDINAPSGWEMTTRAEDENFYPVGLVGGSYSLDSGMSISLEYLYNGAGYTPSEMDDLFAMADDLSGIDLYPVSDHARLNRARAINPGIAFLRRHYVMGEIRQIDLFDVLTFSLRSVVGLEDKSWQVSSLVEWVLTDNLELFFVGAANAGKTRSEFGRFLRHTAMLGLELRL